MKTYTIQTERGPLEVFQKYVPVTDSQLAMIRLTVDGDDEARMVVDPALHDEDIDVYATVWDRRLREIQAAGWSLLPDCDLDDDLSVDEDGTEWYPLVPWSAVA